MPYQVIVAEDHRILREGIQILIERSAEFIVIGEAENGCDAVRICRKLEPDIILMDIGLPEMNGIEATTEIVRCCPRTKVVILSMYDDENTVMAAFRSGVKGFLVKKTSGTDLLDALHTVSQGGLYLSPEISSQLVSRIQHGDLDRKPTTLDTLSPREHQILGLLVEGKTSKDIAKVLNLQ